MGLPVAFNAVWFCSSSQSSSKIKKSSEEKKKKNHRAWLDIVVEGEYSR
jgi:hypothetical protein